MNKKRLNFIRCETEIPEIIFHKPLQMYIKFVFKISLYKALISMNFIQFQVD